MRGYTGPLAGELTDGWRWWKASFERDIYACAPDTSLVWIEEDGTERHLDDAPPAVRRALRRRWCEMWGWTVSQSRLVIGGKPAVSVETSAGRVWYYTEDSLDSASRPRWFPAPVRALVADMIDGGARAPIEPVFPAHERSSWDAFGVPCLAHIRLLAPVLNSSKPLFSQRLADGFCAGKVSGAPRGKWNVCDLPRHAMASLHTERCLYDIWPVRRGQNSRMRNDPPFRCYGYGCGEEKASGKPPRIDSAKRPPGAPAADYAAVHADELADIYDRLAALEAIMQRGEDDGHD